jgi:hypothetical protein
VALGALRFFVHARRLLERPAVAAALRRRGMRASLALYLPRAEVVGPLVPAAAALVPEDTRLYLLPDHGARGVADQVPGWSALRAAAHPPALITWLEFDGSMFLPQAWTRALHDGADAAAALPVSGLFANHWRVSGLEADAWMFAASAWTAAPYDALLRGYLERVYGAAAAEARAAQEALESATLHARDRLFNVAFSWETYRHRPYPAGELARSEALFTTAALAFERLAAAATTPLGRERARLLADRCRTAPVHLRAVQALARSLEADERAQAAPAELLAAAEEAAAARREGMEYLRLYARHVLDRGDQGMLVAYHYSVVDRARVLEQRLRARAAGQRR